MIGVIEVEGEDMLFVSVCFVFELLSVVFFVYLVFGEVCIFEFNV